MTATTSPDTVRSDARAAHQLLRIAFTVAPIAFGVDKFLGLLVDWAAYLPSFVTDVVDGSVVMGVVGVVEIAAGIGVWLRPRIFAWVVAGWLAVIIATLAAGGSHWDVALRDVGLLAGAAALGLLSRSLATD